MIKAVFTMNGFEYPHIGYTSGRLWNGWATPHFEIDEARAIMKEFNECAEFPMQYDEIYDQFYILDTETTELEVWKGENCQTKEGIKHLYGIGAYAWVWDSVSQANIKSVAQKIEDFLWELDTYEHRDNYNSREELTEEIISQLQDLNTLKQVLIIFYAEELTKEELYNKLKEELKI